MWDYGKVAGALQTGRERCEFVEDFESQFRLAKDEFDAEKECPTSDVRWLLWMKAVQEAGMKHFSRNGKCSKPELVASLHGQRSQLLAARASWRQLLATVCFGDRGAAEQMLAEIAGMLAHASRAIKHCGRLLWAMRRVALERDIQEAYRSGRKAEEMRPSRALAGTGVGLKKRFYRSIPPCRPSASDFAEVVEKSGMDGGMMARVQENINVTIADLRGKAELLQCFYHGYLPGRRREGAMLSQRALGERLRVAGVRHLNDIKDMTNAFASAREECRERAIVNLTKEDDRLIMRRHIIEPVEEFLEKEANTLSIYTLDGRRKEGAISIYADDSFTKFVMELLVKMKEKVARPRRRRGVLRQPGHIDKDEEELPLACRAGRRIEESDKAFCAKGFAQNKDKRMIVPCLRSDNQTKLFMEFLPKNVVGRRSDFVGTVAGLVSAYLQHRGADPRSKAWRDMMRSSKVMAIAWHGGH